MPAPRRIGQLEVHPLGLGCLPLTLAYGRPDRARATATVRAALDAGVTLFDTADLYASGRNELLLGEAVRGRRQEVALATKFGIVAAPLLGAPLRVDARPARARQCLEASLRRLRTDHVDLFYLHRVDPAVPVEETVGAMADLVAAGLVREIGLCEVTAAQLRRARTVHPVAAVQSEWSVFTRGVETQVVAEARAAGTALVAYSPLGRGMLTGAPGATTSLPWLDVRRLMPRWRGDHLHGNLRTVARFTRLAADAGLTPNRLALAWLLHQGDDVVPIPGTSRPAHLRDNLAAADVQLTPGLLAELDDLRAVGGRGGFEVHDAG